MYLTLKETKKHLNIDDDYTDDDDYLVQLSEVAEQIVSKHIDCDFDEVADESGELPLPLRQAMLLMIGNLYANRESVSYVNASEIPFAYDYLLSLYKKY